jgi:hypothetical protein
MLSRKIQMLFFFYYIYVFSNEHQKNIRKNCSILIGSSKIVCVYFFEKKCIYKFFENIGIFVNSIK